MRHHLYALLGDTADVMPFFGRVTPTGLHGGRLRWPHGCGVHRLQGARAAREDVGRPREVVWTSATGETDRATPCPASGGGQPPVAGASGQDKHGPTLW